jgi:hypothetical protein
VKESSGHSFCYLNLSTGFDFLVPILIGKTILEKIARIVALCIVGKIGRHLFLTDDTERTHSLLLRMVEDSEECYLRYVCYLSHFHLLLYKKFVCLKGSLCL